MPENQVFEYVVLQGQNRHQVRVFKQDNQFNLSINGSNVYVDDSFKLCDEILSTKINSNEDITMQLVSRSDSGDISLQFLGTKVKFI